MNKSKKNNFFLTALLTSFAIFFIIFFLLKSLLSGIDLNLKYSIKNLYSQNNVSKNIVLVKIDDKTTNKLGWPFDRENYIKIVENLKKDGAKIIAFDVLFLDNSKNKKTDELLAKTFKEAGNIIIGGKITKKNILSTPIFLDKNFSKKNKNNQEKIFYKNSVEKIGFYNPTINKNGKIYSIKPQVKLKNGIKIDHIAFSIIKKFLNKENLLIDNKKEFIINYEKAQFFKKESFLDIYNGNFKKGTFKNKIVVIGYTAEGAMDRYEIPGIGQIKGVYIILNTINNFLTKTYTKNLNSNLGKIFIFLIIFSIIYINLKIKNISQIKWFIFGSISILIILFILYFGIYLYFAKEKNIYILMLYPGELILSVFFSFFASIIFKYLKEDKNKKLLNKALSEYVSKEISEEILSGKGKINLKGEKKEIAIFFSDIEGFTTISEKLDAKELVAFLQKYLGAMSEIIMENKGFIDKYEGDAIMALFGIFGKTGETKTFDILESALLQQKKLQELNKDFKEFLGEELKIRMGIHNGEAIIGNIGAKGKKMEFTALGDSVNLASRLEGVNKFYNTYICCSENIYLEQKEKFCFRFLDNIKVKGKHNGVKIYELLGRIGEVSDIKKEIKKIFEEALDYYFKKDFTKAIELLKKSEKLGDKTSTVFIFRCEYLLKNPVKENWNGIWEMKEK